MTTDRPPRPAEYFEEDNKVYLIMEMLQGGELLDAVLDKVGGGVGLACDVCV